MYKAVIVEDEQWVIELILHITKWSDFGFEIVGTANDGIKGLEMIKELKPDLILTDIRIPGMSGIEMLERAAGYVPNARSIIISGYSDYKYMQMAIQLKVTDYLLKPIDKGELENLLKKVNEELSSSDRRTASDRQSLDVLIDYLSLYLNSLIWEPENNPPNFERLNELATSYGISKNGCLCMMLCRSNIQNETIEDIPENLVGSLEENITSIFAGQCSNILFVRVYRMVFIVFLLDKNTKESLAENIKKELFEKIFLLRQDFMIGLNKTVCSFTDIASAFESAFSSMLTSLKKNRVCLYKPYAASASKKSGLLYSNSDFSFIIERGDTAVLNDFFINRFSALDKDKNNSYLSGVKLSKYFIEQMAENLMRKYDLPHSFIGHAKQLSRNSLACYTSASLSEFCLDAYQTLKKKACNEAFNAYSKPIKRALDIISTEYYTELTLDSIAERVHLTPVYFSMLFKKETKVNFSDYLTKCRIGAAKVLLEESQHKNKEICEMVGYQDARYFSKVFKKYTGKTPSEYKKYSRTP